MSLSPVTSSRTRVNVAEVADYVAPSVVTISADVNGGTSLGTGVIISTDGEILTNAHVVEGRHRDSGAPCWRNRTASGQLARRGSWQRPGVAADEW